MTISLRRQSRARVKKRLGERTAVTWKRKAKENKPAAPPFTPPPDSFNDVYIPHLENYTRTQIFFGGAGSGKSVFLAQRDVLDILKGGRNFLICRAVANTIRRSVFAEIKKIIGEWGLSGRFSINKSEMTITGDNGYQMLFAGLDDTEKLKSITPEKGVITDVRIEEATETDPDSIRQLYRRQRGGDPDTPKRLTMSLNPILQTHHIYTRYFTAIAWADGQTEYNDGRLSILKTWYIHNRFLTEDDIADLEGETDEYFRSVYTFGEWGILGDVIFTDWRVEDLSAMRPLFVNRRNGLDFGFASDPAALARTHYDKKRKTIYFFEEYYERGLTNDILAEEIRPLLDGDYVICDSAEPKSIEELKKYRVRALGAVKGKDSVNHGIQWLRQQTIIIDKSCVNARNEMMTYQWKKDKDGNSLRIPIDKNNHLIDAIRYGYEDDMVFAPDPAADNIEISEDVYKPSRERR